MILLDTSVVIDGLRRRSDALRQVFVDNEAAICGVTQAEVLHGARTAEDFDRLATALDVFPRVPISERTWDAVGRTLYALRVRGISVPFPDAVIATVAVENGFELWTRDAQFATIQSAVTELKLFPEPP